MSFPVPYQRLRGLRRQESGAAETVRHVPLGQ